MRVIQTTHRPASPGAPKAQTVTHSAAPELVPRVCAFVPDTTPGHAKKPVLYVPPKASDAHVTIAKPHHKKEVMELQRKFSNELGFLPSKAIDWYLEQSLVAVAAENGEPCGYLLGRERFAYQPLMRPITQAAVFMDAQRRHHGLALVNALCNRAVREGQHVVQCSCANDIDAVDFWLTAGFLPVGSHKLDNKRKRDIIVFRRLLVPHCPKWFWDPPHRAGHNARLVTPP